jgi:hypothetical protein
VEGALRIKNEGLKTGHSGEIDFVASRTQGKEVNSPKAIEFAMEVKWKKTKQPKFEISRDYEKLILFKKREPNADVVICVFGRENAIAKCELYLSNSSIKRHRWPKHPKYEEIGKPVIAKLGKTSYGCRIFRLT